MTYRPPKKIYRNQVALQYSNDYDRGWFGYSGWFKRIILGRKFSLSSEPCFISRHDANVIQKDITMEGVGRYTVWELVQVPCTPTAKTEPATMSDFGRDY